MAGKIAGKAHRKSDAPPASDGGNDRVGRIREGVMLIATYDYWGYYNVCFLGDEVKDPGRNIPRALLLSILLVAGLYIVMNLSILAVLPWREMTAANSAGSGLYVVSLFMRATVKPPIQQAEALSGWCSRREASPTIWLSVQRRFPK